MFAFSLTHDSGCDSVFFHVSNNHRSAFKHECDWQRKFICFFVKCGISAIRNIIFCWRKFWRKGRRNFLEKATTVDIKQIGQIDCVDSPTTSTGIIGSLKAVCVGFWTVELRWKVLSFDYVKSFVAMKNFRTTDFPHSFGAVEGKNNVAPNNNLPLTPFSTDITSLQLGVILPD